MATTPWSAEWEPCEFLRNSFVGSRANIALHAFGIVVRAPCPEPLRLHCHYEKQTREEFQCATLIAAVHFGSTSFKCTRQSCMDPWYIAIWITNVHCVVPC